MCYNWCNFGCCCTNWVNVCTKYEYELYPAWLAWKLSFSTLSWPWKKIQINLNDTFVLDIVISTKTFLIQVKQMSKKLEILHRKLESAEQNLTPLHCSATQFLLPYPLKPQLFTSPKSRLIHPLRSMYMYIV